MHAGGVEFEPQTSGDITLSPALQSFFIRLKHKNRKANPAITGFYAIVD
jgi:hypothetical protein